MINNLDFRVENFKRCLDDCDAALHYGKGQGSDNEYLLLDRKAKCYAGLGRNEEAKEHFEQAKIAVENANSVADVLKNAFMQQADGNIAKLKKDKDITEESSNEYDVTMKERNIDHSSMSKKIEIQYSEDRGRYVTAAEDIPAGEVILIEKPNISWSHFGLENDMSKACHHCLNALCPFMAYFSPLVDGIAFCSWPCLQKAMDSYHQHER